MAAQSERKYVPFWTLEYPQRLKGQNLDRKDVLPVLKEKSTKFGVRCTYGRRWSGAEGFVFCSPLGTGETCLQSRLCQQNMQLGCSPDLIQAWSKF
ncbi:hypothetical protein chiPu_0009751 [Chiloscyllium punctatum]|uniref:Uncharacterized protein n=1 Tax=Chiloscyllium punctatum TaxID=137246 RepID=A0A401SLM6_CHIPU|nr:hypothetical protein [Chiloscyllium punctatum]